MAYRSTLGVACGPSPFDDGFTADGQANAGMVDRRDRGLKIQSRDKRKEQENIAALAGADAWQQGDIKQLSLQSLNLA